MRTNANGFHTWDEDELQRFFEHHHEGSVAHTAVTLMLYTACARSDVVKLGWQNLKGDRLQYRRQKTEGVSTILIDIPVHPELRKVLARLPRDKLTFLETRAGRSRTATGLGTAMRKWCDDAGLPKCAAHGLRKACATRLAEAGATEREIMAWTGHMSPTMVQVYAGKARRGLLADHGFEKLIKNEKGSKNDEPNAKGSTQ
ncbi:MAG: tyrosine-type recombinase/integrase [Pseudophaeobacter sp.]|jgi:integrase|uniref:tyrosine-type recombinase/integrase n=1 Tax=Pseudophaeobacter sp. TaxID=1971739 RepID=UPI0032D947E3